MSKRESSTAVRPGLSQLCCRGPMPLRGTAFTITFRVSEPNLIFTVWMRLPRGVVRRQGLSIYVLSSPEKEMDWP